MVNWKKIATVALIGGVTVAVVAVGINYLSSRTTNIISLSPGFKRKFVSVTPASISKGWIECYRHDSKGDPQLFTPGTDAYHGVYGDNKAELTLELKEDFTKPIIITVKAVNSKPGGDDADPAIKISTPDGSFSTCYDYTDGHGNEEVLNTSDRNVERRFEPKKGTYYIDLWSYYQPAKEYQVIFSEGN